MNRIDLAQKFRILSVQPLSTNFEKLVKSNRYELKTIKGTECSNFHIVLKS